MALPNEAAHDVQPDDLGTGDGCKLGMDDGNLHPGNLPRLLAYLCTSLALAVRVAFLSSSDPADVHHWSGLVHYIHRAIARQPGVEMLDVPRLLDWARPAVRARQVWHRASGRRRHVREQDPLTLAALGWQATRHVRVARPDVVFAPGFHYVAGIRARVPVVTYTDATFADLEGHYDAFSSLSDASVRHGAALSRDAAQRFAMLCFAAPHAARSAVETYGADPARVRVIPFGANLDAPPSAGEAEAALAARERARREGAPVRLLFLGVDWERKGGPLAVEVVAGLRAAGVDAVLDVAGCDPPADAPPWVNRFGFVSKATPEGQARLKALLAAAQFLLLPTLAEAFGVVFCEASAHAVPSLTRRVGGVPVWDGENGYALPPDAGAAPYVAHALRLLRDDAAYDALARASRAVYDDRLNWDAAGAALVAAFHDAIRLGPPR